MGTGLGLAELQCSNPKLVGMVRQEFQDQGFKETKGTNWVDVFNEELIKISFNEESNHLRGQETPGKIAIGMKTEK
jgi:hypothetical protein